MRWKRNGASVTRGLHSLGRRLTISSPAASDAGLYECEATLQGSSAEPARAQAFLSLIGNSTRCPASQEGSLWSLLSQNWGWEWSLTDTRPPFLGAVHTPTLGDMMAIVCGVSRV